MRRGTSSTPSRMMTTGVEFTPFTGGNPEMWLQLREGTCSNIDVMLLETVEQLRTEMENLRANNERLRLEQERILKSISEKQNQRHPTPSPEDENMNEEHQQRVEYFGMDGSRMDNEEGSENVSGGKGNKRQKNQPYKENSRRLNLPSLMEKRKRLLRPRL